MALSLLLATVASMAGNVPALQIEMRNILAGAAVDITVAGDSVYEDGDVDWATGVKSKGDVLIASGSLVINNAGSIAASCYDDAINCAGQIVFNGGYVYVRSTGNDGIDSNGTGFLFNGGVVLSSGTSGAEEGFDCDNYPFSIQGGTLVGIGGATSTPTSAAQPYASVSGVSITAGKYLGVKTADGTLLFAMKCPNTLSNATVVLSHPQFAAATTYTLVYNATSVNVPDLTLFDGDYCEGGTTTDGSNKTFTPKTK